MEAFEGHVLLPDEMCVCFGIGFLWRVGFFFSLPLEEIFNILMTPLFR